jgi:two-component system alkaline phosphatase synthesis response regulator PhoP
MFTDGYERMKGKRILVVEDDEGLAELLCDNLRFEGYQVEHATDGEKALTIARTFAPDLILLDIVLPGRNGFELCHVWRRQRIAIIMITARSQKHDKMRGFAVGADDYVTKPFDLEELLARVHAVLQRARPETRSQVNLGSVTIDFRTLEAWNEGQRLELTSREFELLQYLMERPNTVVYRDELLREVWRYTEVLNTRAVDHAVVRLRRKIENDPHNPKFIQTVHGDGYRLVLHHDAES